MKINIYHETKIYSTTIKNPISVRDIITNIKNIITKNEGEYLLLNESRKIIPELELITPKKEKIQNFYLIKPSKNYIKKEEKELEIEEIIKEVTGAKNKLENKKKEEEINRLNIFENRVNLLRLYDMIQFLEDRNMIFQIRNIQEGNIEANENLVNQLKDMGFPEDRSRDALIRARNDLSIATNILLGEE